MKYFNETHFLDEEKLKEEMNSYMQAFSKIKHRLPEDFVKYYLSGSLHDAEITNIQMYNEKKKVAISIDFVSHNKKQKFNVTYDDVTEYNINWQKENKYNYNTVGDYVTGEILSDSDGSLTHEFTVFESKNVFFIRFKTLKFKLL